MPTGRHYYVSAVGYGYWLQYHPVFSDVNFTPIRSVVIHPPPIRVFCPLFVLCMSMFLSPEWLRSQACPEKKPTESWPEQRFRFTFKIQPQDVTTAMYILCANLMYICICI